MPALLAATTSCLLERIQLTEAMLSGFRSTQTVFDALLRFEKRIRATETQLLNFHAKVSS